MQCEACYTPLPQMVPCPNCGALVQTDASFCGQCGFNLKTAPSSTAAIASKVPPEAAVPDLALPEPLVMPDPLFIEGLPSAIATPEVPPMQLPDRSLSGEFVPTPAVVVPVSAAPSLGGEAKTQLQQQTARLIHVQTNVVIELPQGLSVIHLGKPNERVPPDIDVSGFPDSEVVSRVHADIRVEADAFYIEDVGSSNGTYINNVPLPMGNRHRLRAGDRIALGKGDKVSFLFQLV